MLCFHLNAQSKDTINYDNLPYSVKVKNKIVNENRIFVISKVESFDKKQSLNFEITGLHPKSCSWALVKLSQYEQYSNFLDFVKSSEFKDNRINFLLDSSIMPYPMRLNFVLPRITEPGVYPFKFDKGFLKGLFGKIHVSNHENRCLFHSTAVWVGPETKIPDKIFELFSHTLARISMETLFRISLNP